MGNTIHFYRTADDEEPDCGRCEFICEGNYMCTKCGPEYGWANYRHRVEISEETIERFESFLRNSYGNNNKAEN